MGSLFSWVTLSLPASRSPVCCRSALTRVPSGAPVGAAPGEVDLLPMPGPNANWTAGLSVHYSQDSSLIYWFNGTQAVQVPLGGSAGLGSGSQDNFSDHFTLSFWMKHGVTPNKGKKEEETIVCNTVQNGEPSSGHRSETGWGVGTAGFLSCLCHRPGYGCAWVTSSLFTCKTAVLGLLLPETLGFTPNLTG